MAFLYPIAKSCFNQRFKYVQQNINSELSSYFSLLILLNVDPYNLEFSTLQNNDIFTRKHIGFSLQQIILPY